MLHKCNDFLKGTRWVNIKIKIFNCASNSWVQHLVKTFAVFAQKITFNWNVQAFKSFDDGDENLLCAQLNIKIYRLRCCFASKLLLLGIWKLVQFNSFFFFHAKKLAKLITLRLRNGLEDNFLLQKMKAWGFNGINKLITFSSYCLIILCHYFTQADHFHNSFHVPR